MTPLPLRAAEKELVVAAVVQAVADTPTSTAPNSQAALEFRVSVIVMLASPPLRVPNPLESFDDPLPEVPPPVPDALFQTTFWLTPAVTAMLPLLASTASTPSQDALGIVMLGVVFAPPVQVGGPPLQLIAVWGMV